MQVQRISNYQTNYKKSEPAFGLKIINGKNLQAAIDKSPAKETITKRIADLVKRYEYNPNTYKFEMSSKGIVSIESARTNTTSVVTDPTLSNSSEIISIMSDTVRAI